MNSARLNDDVFMFYLLIGPWVSQSEIQDSMATGSITKSYKMIFLLPFFFLNKAFSTETAANTVRIVSKDK